MNVSSQNVFLWRSNELQLLSSPEFNAQPLTRQFQYLSPIRCAVFSGLISTWFINRGATGRRRAQTWRLNSPWRFLIDSGSERLAVCTRCMPAPRSASARYLTERSGKYQSMWLLTVRQKRSTCLRRSEARGADGRDGFGQAVCFDRAFAIGLAVSGKAVMLGRVSASACSAWPLFHLTLASLRVRHSLKSRRGFTSVA